jgi:hypothetical protein
VNGQMKDKMREPLEHMRMGLRTSARNRWTLIPDEEHYKKWLKWAQSMYTTRSFWPESFPCLVTAHVSGHSIEPCFVYKFEAETLSLLPYKSDPYLTQNSLPELPPE